MKWVSEHVEKSDVLARFKNRRSTLTLYYCASNCEAPRIFKDGLVDRDHHGSDNVEARAGIELSDVLMEGIHGGTRCILIDLPEDDVLPYEVTQQADEYRSFILPAYVANRPHRRLDES